MRQTTLHLTDSDRQAITAFRSKGIRSARSVNRAHILSVLDQGIREKDIMRVLGIGRTALWRTRGAYLEQGLVYALKDAPRLGQPLKYPAQPAAEVCALACTPPPAGAKRWTLKLLTQAAQSRPGLQGVSRETIRRILKKTFCAPGRK